MRADKDRDEDKQDLADQNSEFPKERIIFIRLKDKRVELLDFLASFKTLVTRPKGKNGKWCKQTNEKSGDTKTKCPGEMVRFPTLHIDIVN